MVSCPVQLAVLKCVLLTHPAWHALTAEDMFDTQQQPYGDAYVMHTVPSGGAGNQEHWQRLSCCSTHVPLLLHHVRGYPHRC